MKLELSNIGRTVKIKIDSIELQYLGPKNLIKFNEITDIKDGVLYVDTKFNDGKGRVYNEEDYIDLRDLLNEFEYDTESILAEIYEYTIKEKQNLTKEDLINRALFVSDNFSFIRCNEYKNDNRVYAVNLTHRNRKALIDAETCTILTSNMSDNMVKRAVRNIKRNSNIILGKM